MKTIQTVQGLCLIALFVGPLQVLCLTKIPLTMFNNSVDDQYIGCNLSRELELLESGKIPLDEMYNNTWKKAKSHWEGLSKIIDSFKPIYGIAIVAYTVADHLYLDFNTATREAGKSPKSYDCYAFQDFHLLLTKALQAKKTKQNCYEVFRGIKNFNFTVSPFTVVRFGQFASSSLDENEAKKFGEDTFFSIKTCYGVPIHDFSYKPSQKEVLIPPYETFNVTNCSIQDKRAFIRLESHGKFSRWNCKVLNAAGLSTPLAMPFLLCGLFLTWTILGSLGSL